MEWSKRVLPVVMIVLVSQMATGQGVIGFFTQKQTQTQYLIQQITALKIYAGYLNQGYKIVDGGLKTIGDLKEGHLKLDESFFDGLKSIHPKVRRRAAEVLKLHKEIPIQILRGMKLARASKAININEKDFVVQVFENIKVHLSKLYSELELAIDSQLSMSDDERLIRVEKVYDAMQSLQVFLKSFYKDLQKLEIQKQQELKDVKVLKILYP